MLEASRERFSRFSSSQNLLISCRPSSLKRRRVSSGQDLARTLTPASKGSTPMASKLEVDRYANLQPSMKIDYSRLILQAMRERAADTTISNQEKQEWNHRIAELMRLLPSNESVNKTDHSMLEVIHLEELLVAVNQAGICWSYNICK